MKLYKLQHRKHNHQAIILEFIGNTQAQVGEGRLYIADIPEYYVTTKEDINLIRRIYRGIPVTPEDILYIELKYKTF